MQKAKRKSRKLIAWQSPGFTLLELVVTIAIAGIIFTILGAIFLAQMQFFAIQNAIAETQVHAFRALDTTGGFMSSADAVVAGHVINGTTYSSTDTIAVLELPSIDSTGNIISNAHDYVAIGEDPANASQFMFDIQAAPGSTRLNGKFSKAQLVDKLIFRYNDSTPANATAVDLYIRTSENARGRTITTPLGKIYYLGAQ